MNGKSGLQLGFGIATIGKDIALPGEDTVPEASSDTDRRGPGTSAERTSAATSNMLLSIRI